MQAYGKSIHPKEQGWRKTLKKKYRKAKQICQNEHWPMRAAQKDTALIFFKLLFQFVKELQRES